MDNGCSTALFGVIEGVDKLRQMVLDVNNVVGFELVVQRNRQKRYLLRVGPARVAKRN